MNPCSRAEVHHVFKGHDFVEHMSSGNVKHALGIEARVG